MRNLTSPEGGTPPVIETTEALSRAISELASGTGPIAIDAERASGYRYSSRAYLIQLFRRGGGLHLIDPIPLAGSTLIGELNELISGEESVIHASSQDLECLRDFGIDPKALFDTELGARIAGCERVGLGPLCENLLEISLAKEHSAVDWSHRPLKSEWLDYAALDVAILLDVRDKVEELLIASGKLEWAKEEFENSLKQTYIKVKKDPWRRTSGMHQIKSRFELAIIRELWLARDLVAKEIDLAPGRLLSDAVLIEVARQKPDSFENFVALPIIKEKIRNDIQRSYLEKWWKVIHGSYSIAEPHWPEMRARGEALPPPRAWREKFPIAFMHLQHARLFLGEISEQLNIPVENLIQPDLVRKILFDDGKERVWELSDASQSEIRATLLEAGARNWQVKVAVEPIARSLTMSEPPEIPPPTE